jgi:DNA-binding NarL/FixJ family response regulator
MIHSDADPNVDQEVLNYPSFDMLRTQWARQTRAFAHSVQMYQVATNRRKRGLIRAEVMTSMTLSRMSPLAATPAPGPHNGAAAATPPDQSHTCGPGPLTRRQTEIAQLIAHGLSNEEIARQLVLTPGTVGNHVGHILRRLGARNRVQVAAWITTRAAAANEPDGVHTS